jgi:hypothetical protein
MWKIIRKVYQIMFIISSLVSVFILISSEANSKYEFNKFIYSEIVYYLYSICFITVLFNIMYEFMRLFVTKFKNQSIVLTQLYWFSLLFYLLSNTVYEGLYWVLD